MMHQRFSVTGMSCAACSARVEKCVGSLPGVKKVEVNLLARSMQVQYDENQQTENSIIAEVERAGYGASTGDLETTLDSGIRKRFFLSLFCLLPMMYLHHTWHNHLSFAAQSFLLIPILILNRHFFISGTRAALQGSPNMNTLISLGAAAGIIYSVFDLLILHSGVAYLESAGMILTIITLGKWLESRASGRTGEAIEKLKAMLPQTATVLRHGERAIIPAEEVQAGDLLFIAPGDKVPVDATVTEGESCIDDSSLTGESIPVLKREGELIYAGTINGNGVLQAKALCSRSESALSNVIHLVGEAAASKVPIARLADKISRIFVPLIVGLSFLTALLWLIFGADIPFATGCGIAVLVISCPCALGLATPVAIMAGAGKGAESGILFRDGSSMETTSRVSAIILDKTGTVTIGKPAVISITPAEKVSKNTLLQLACTLEQDNTHPIAQCIRKQTSIYTPQKTDKLEYIPGRGIYAQLNGGEALAGNAELMHEHGISTPKKQFSGMTTLHFASHGQYMGTILIADPIKPESREAIRIMKQSGIRVIMMSGDNEATVSQIAEQAGIEEYHAAATPQEKEAMVRQLQSEGLCVAMIGDGINDAPALTRADVGIAIGAGADVAVESAGIILVRSNLMDAVAALKLGKAVLRTIRQNLFWAFIYNLLTIPLAAGALYPATGLLLSPEIAATAMSLSSLFVVGNALRLRQLELPHPILEKMNTITLSVEGMMCPHCERHVTQALSALPGVNTVKADHQTSTVIVSSDTPLDESMVAAIIREAGYDYKGTR